MMPMRQAVAHNAARCLNCETIPAHLNNFLPSNQTNQFDEKKPTEISVGFCTPGGNKSYTDYLFIVNILGEVWGKC